MGVYRNKHSFTAGEISPLMYDRVDFERYQNGCKTLKNMVCATQGPAIRRPGFAFINDLSSLGLDGTDPRVRLVPFIFNELQAYVLVFFMHTDGSPRVVFATTNSSGESGLVLGEGVDKPCIEESEAYTGVGDYEYDHAITAAADLMVWHVSAGGTKTDLVLTTDYTVAVASPNVVTVTNAVITGGTIHIARVGAAETEVVELVLPKDWDIEAFDWAQSGDEVIIAQPDVQPNVIKRWGNACWELVEVTFTDQPTDWSDDYGWPERVVYHQQRLMFGANLLRPQTVWASQAGDFYNFGTSSPAVDSDAITFTLDGGTQNRIQWMSSGKSLHIGTLGGEWTVSAAQTTALTPSDILAQRQTNNGSEPNKPLLVGLTTLFVERHGRTVNEFVYDYTYDSYKTTDMAILSPHITEQYSITDWAYQQTPYGIIWCVREDGALLGITYQRQHKVVGWHRHDTQGEFKAVAVIPGETREDDLWAVVMREVDGAEVYYLEKLSDWFTGTTAAEGRFLDSYVTYSGTAVDTITSGLDHLEGCTVSVLANGTVHPDVVVTSGEIELDNEYTALVIGLSYESEVRPTVPDLPLQDGTSWGRLQRVTKVMVDFYRSLGAYYGRADDEDEDVEEELPFRLPSDDTGEAVPLFTGWKTIDFFEGYDREVEYFFKQKQPLPMTIRCVVDYVEVTE
jgi:hypothetical protein